MKASVVIGANYGDEGKGKLTDFLAEKTHAKLVVRYNGGAQAGHTVNRYSRRYVFSHFGSGTLVGVPTFLSKFFAVNPILFFRELNEFFGEPLVYVDGRAPVTTLYDILLNQTLETSRGGSRHGSCGVGFGETIGRHEQPEDLFHLVVEDLKDEYLLRYKLESIRRKWIPLKEREHGISVEKTTLSNNFIFERFVNDCKDFMNKVIVKDRFNDVDSVVFEGAQGLGLDMDQGEFPHVTRSHTGLKNVIELATENGIRDLDVTYVTRVYNTRHGAGPLKHEIKGTPYDVVETTNVTNMFQGVFRYGHLNLDDLGNRIAFDLHQVKGSGINVNPTISVTCTDQVKNHHVRFVRHDKEYSVNGNKAAFEISRSVNLPLFASSFGPTHTEIET